MQAPLPPAFAFADASGELVAVPGDEDEAAVAADDEFHHLPVMVEEVVELFRPVPAGLYVDATLGGGGHASAVLRPDPTSVSSASTEIPSQWQRRARRSNPSGTG